MRMRFAICLLALGAATPAHLIAQASDCNDPHASAQANAMAQQQWGNGRSPVYRDATDLVRELASRGIAVECIRRSKEEHLFDGQKGAAWFKTVHGAFEVWFLPDAGAAEAATAAVAARPAPISLPSGPNQFFIQHENLVFHVGMGNQELATSIKNAFQAR
jgi:hypothetical protein